MALLTLKTGNELTNSWQICCLVFAIYFLGGGHNKFLTRIFRPICYRKRTIQLDLYFLPSLAKHSWMRLTNRCIHDVMKSVQSWRPTDIQRCTSFFFIIFLGRAGHFWFAVIQCSQKLLSGNLFLGQAY